MKTSFAVCSLLLLMLLMGCAGTMVYKVQPEQIHPMTKQEARDNLELALSLEVKSAAVKATSLRGDQLIVTLTYPKDFDAGYSLQAIPEVITREGNTFVVNYLGHHVIRKPETAGMHATRHYFKSLEDARLFVDSGYILNNNLFADYGHAGVKTAAGSQLKRASNLSVPKTTDQKPGIAKQGIPFPEAAMEKPVISVTAPDIGRAVKESNITINGVAQSKIGIADVYINDQQATLDENGQFSADILLKVGINEIKIMALDVRKNRSTKQFVIYREKVVLAKDNSSASVRITEKDIPRIVITSPDITRAISIVARQNVVTVGGTVESRTGLMDVTVNDQPADLDDKGNFSAEIPLKVGQNEITVKARDILKNEATKIFVLSRASGQVATVKVSADEHQSFFQAAKYYALIIAIQNYESSEIVRLDYPVSDASRLVDTLTLHYTFERENVRFLQNPDRRSIYKTLQELKNKLTVNDNLLIFYAGHGYWVDDMKEGFWLPRDAAGINDPSDWVPNSTIRNYIKSIKAKHVLLVADACFSGGIFKMRDLQPAQQRTSVEKIYELPSRKAITSGAMKTVPDRSVFLDYLLKRLNENKDEYLDAQKLFANLRDAVINNSPANQTPLYGAIAEVGDEGGDFIFVKRY